MHELIAFSQYLAQAGALQESEFIKVITALIFWVGGYFAAPVLFMATLGVFKNLAGMGTGMFKQARGKLSDKTNARFREDKGVREQRLGRERTFEAQRSKLNYRQRRKAGIMGTLRGEANTVAKPSRGEWRDAQEGILKAGVLSSTPSIISGKTEEDAKKQAFSAAMLQLTNETVNRDEGPRPRSLNTGNANTEGTLQYLTRIATDSSDTTARGEYRRQAAIAQLTQQQDVNSLETVKAAGRSDQVLANSFNQALPENYSAMKAISPSLAREVTVGESPIKTASDAIGGFKSVGPEHHAGMKLEAWQNWKAIDPSGAQAAYDAVQANPTAKGKLPQGVDDLF